MGIKDSDSSNSFVSLLFKKNLISERQITFIYPVPIMRHLKKVILLGSINMDYYKFYSDCKVFSYKPLSDSINMTDISLPINQIKIEEYRSSGPYLIAKFDLSEENIKIPRSKFNI